MTAIEVFAYKSHEVRTVVIDDEPWFVLADLCKVLDLEQVSRVKARLDDALTSSTPILDSLGREQQATIVSEPGMYEVVLRSDKPEAAAFRRWITSEVLPSIRRTGGYGVQDLTAAVERMTTMQWVDLATGLTRRAELAEAKVAELEPKADQWDAFADAHGTYDLNAVAKILGTGRQRLMRQLRDDKVLTLSNLPRQEHVDAGRFEVKTSSWTRPDGEQQVSRSTRVTPKGLDWLSKRYAQPGKLVAIRNPA